MNALPVTIIENRRGAGSLALRDAWASRELLYFLVWRDLKVRYRQTVLGAAWALVQPAAAMVIFTVVFGRLAQLPSDGVPYPLFAYAGLVPWTYFATATAAGAASVTAQQNLIAKVYFPRILIPAAAVLTPVIDAVIALSLAAVLCWWFGVAPSAGLLALPGFLVLAIVAAFGVSLLLSAVNVRYRDVRYVMPFLIQVWLFATPVAYPSSLIPERWRPFAGLNPMASVVDGFRWAIGSAPPPSVEMLALSILTTIAAVVAGSVYFARVERDFADII